MAEVKKDFYKFIYPKVKTTKVTPCIVDETTMMIKEVDPLVFLGKLSKATCERKVKEAYPDNRAFAGEIIYSQLTYELSKDVLFKNGTVVESKQIN